MLPLVITMGDPTGVGPEIIVKALLQGALQQVARPLLVAGDTRCLWRAAQVFGAEARVEQVESPLATHQLQVGEVSLLVRALSDLPEDLPYGQPDDACARAMAEYVEWSVAACRDGRAAGMVTAPISKVAINAAGVLFPGHTELLAQRCGVDKVVMMLAGHRLRVCLVTTHVAYREVPERLTRDEVLATIRITHDALQRQFGLETPRLGLAALNPHAGENGLFGDEEERLIRPAALQARREGIDVTDPLASDTLFWAAAAGEYDAVVCMYHDQGLIPLKLLHFEDAVNVTLGLPIVRTSVDHGTAYDLAGSGRANPASLIAAIEMAAAMTHGI